MLVLGNIHCGYAIEELVHICLWLLLTSVDGHLAKQNLFGTG